MNAQTSWNNVSHRRRWSSGPANFGAYGSPSYAGASFGSTFGGSFAGPTQIPNFAAFAGVYGDGGLWQVRPAVGVGGGDQPYIPAGGLGSPYGRVCIGSVEKRIACLRKGIRELKSKGKTDTRRYANMVERLAELEARQSAASSVTDLLNMEPQLAALEGELVAAGGSISPDVSEEKSMVPWVVGGLVVAALLGAAYYQWG